MEQESYSIKSFQQRLINEYKEVGVPIDPTREGILEEVVSSFEIGSREQRNRRKQREIPPDQLMDLELLTEIGDMFQFNLSENLQRVIINYVETYRPTTSSNEHLTDEVALDLYQNAVDLLDASNNKNPFSDYSKHVETLLSRTGGESHILNYNNFVLLHGYLFASGLIEEEAPLPKVFRANG